MKKTSLLALLGIIVLIIIFGASLKYTGSIILDDEILFIPVSVHLVDDGDDYTTNRDKSDIRRVFKEANRIWKQGKIEFIVEDIDTIKVNRDEFSLVFRGNVDVLMKRTDFDKGVINAYFANYFNANGVSFSPHDFFIVADLTTVNDYRTTAHELGHLLGLHHVQGRENLMFNGANGEILSQEEIDTARENANKLI